MAPILKRMAQASAVFFAVIAPIQDAGADTLRQAMADAYTSSPLLDQNRFLLRIQDENVAQQVAALRPVVSFAASAQRTETSRVTTTTATMSLVAELVLYAGGTRRIAVEAARETVLATRQQLVALEQQVLLDAVTAYMDVWRNLQVVDVSQRNVRVIQQQLRAARDRFEVGEDTRTDVAQAEAQLAQARSNLAAAQGSLEISRELFNLAIGRYPHGLSGPGHLPTLPRSEEAAQALARQEHPLIRAIQHEVTAAELALDEARGRYLPTVTLGGNVTETLENSSNPLAEGTSGTISLSLNQPIYRGGQLAALERTAIAQIAAVRASLNQQVRLNLQSVGNAFARLRIANAQIQASDQRISAAVLAFEGVSQEAQFGSRTTLDVLQAEQDVLDARIARIEAQAELFVAAYAVLAASGLLTVDHLDLNVPRYDPTDYANAVSNAPARFLSPQGERLESVLNRLNRN